MNATPLRDGGPEIDIDVDLAAPGWLTALAGAGEPADIATLAVAAALQAAARQVAVAPHVEVSVRLTDDADIRVLNRDFRDRDQPTNVLSFPLDIEFETGFDGGPVPLGDIVVALETCVGEAREQDKQLADHLRHMVVHGALHLLGFDHADEEEAVEMEALERDVLAGLGVADPYADTVAA